MRRHRRVGLLATLAALALIGSACGTSSNNNGNQPAIGGTLTIDNESGALWQCDFNPYNGSVNGQSFGVLYEPLVYDNLLNDKKTNWLASDYTWSSDSKTLTFTIRSGVKWTDGQPFSADDVVFSFNLIKQHSELDLRSVWQVLDSVTKDSSGKVVMTFKQSAVPNFYQIAGQTAIVPQHIWSAFKDPVSQVVKDPVGTGPFTMSQCTGQNITFTRNPNYWQTGLPRLQTVTYPAFLDNDPANAFLAKAQADKYGYKFDPTKAAALLQLAGYTKGSSGIYQDASGKKLSFTIIDIAGYTDWVASVQVIQDNLKQVGIELKAQNLESNAYFDKLFTGNFQLAYGSLDTSPGPTPYYELRNTLHSGTTAAIGQTAAGDYGRYKNPAVDTLFDQFGATTDSAKQHDLIKQVEAIMLEDVPVIPVTEGVAWYQYSTKDFAGWPTPADPYAAPAPWNLPDWEVTLLHVYKKS